MWNKFAGKAQTLKDENASLRDLLDATAAGHETLQKGWAEETAALRAELAEYKTAMKGAGHISDAARQTIEGLRAELERVTAELETEKDLHHRFEKLALKNAMGYDAAVDRLCQLCRSADRQAGIEPVCAADCPWKEER